MSGSGPTPFAVCVSRVCHSSVRPPCTTGAFACHQFDTGIGERMTRYGSSSAVTSGDGWCGDRNTGRNGRVSMALMLKSFTLLVVSACVLFRERAASA